MSHIIRKIISTAKAPKVVGAPYNQAVLVNNTLYVSGVIGMDMKTMKLVDGGMSAEASKALEYLGFILEAGGSSYDQVIKTTIFMQNMGDFVQFNEIYKKFFTKDFPARSAYQVAALPIGAKIEIEAIALSSTT